MKNKILGIFVCLLLIVATVMPVTGILELRNINNISSPLLEINTYVNDITPYNIQSSPLTITATGPNDLDGVRLFYRWSEDNSSWSGIQEFSIFEGFITGIQNTSLWNTFQTGGDARIQWDWDISHSGAYSCAMDDDDTNQGDAALNVIYTNIDFTDATEISIEFWEREWGDEANEAPDSWTNFGPYDVVAFTNDGTTWYEIISESELNTETFTQFDYTISDDPDFSSPANSNFAIAFQQYDNYQLTSDGRAWDDISINYKTGGGINWSIWEDISNPDTSYPWSWDFDFPNGIGYYEFYSIGFKNGENDETPPLIADARCRYNRMPEIFDENPTNGSTDIELPPELNISVSDIDGDEMTIEWYSNSSGSWQTFGSNISIENGTYSQTNGNFSDFGTTYWWYVSVSDGVYNIYSPVFHFTTFINSPPYTPSDPSPENGENDVPIEVELSWTGGDPNGDSVTYDVYFGEANPPPKVKSNQSTKKYVPDILDFETKYYWKIVAWDEYDYSTNGPVWSFTTEENLPPNSPSNPDPEDGENNIYIDYLIRWTCNDPNTGDPLTFDVYFGTSSPPPLVDQVSHTRYDPGTMVLDTTYYWQIVAEDSGGLTSTGPIWSFTTEKEPNGPPTSPDIYGPHSGPPNEEFTWAFTSNDPDENQIKYFIEWGDGTSIETDYSSVVEEASHTYEEQGEYTIKAKAIDTREAESDWTTLEFVVSKSKSFYFNFPILKWLFERFPNLVPILNYILGI